MKRQILCWLMLTTFVLFSLLLLQRPLTQTDESGNTSKTLQKSVTTSGTIRKITYRNAAGALTVAEDKGYAMALETLDANGDVVLCRYFDAQQSPIQMPSGHSAVSYCKMPEGILLTYLDAEGKPMQIQGGYCKKLEQKDAGGSIRAVFYLDKAGNPTPAAKGQFGERYARDKNGRICQITYLNASGQDAATEQGYTILRRSFRENGSAYEDKYFDAEGQPFCVQKGTYGIRREDGYYLQLNRDGTLLWSVDNLLKLFPTVTVLIGLLFCVVLCVLPRKMSVGMLALYVGFILYETLLFRETGRARLEWIPFAFAKEFGTEYTVRAEVINNIWLFVPLGAGLWRCFPKHKILWLPLLLSLAVELTQYCTRLGFAQVDDVLTNTAGGVLGYLFAKCIKKAPQPDPSPIAAPVQKDLNSSHA